MTSVWPVSKFVAQMKSPPDTSDEKAAAWRELELCREGLYTYDEILFRIRSWSITLTALLIGGYLGFNSKADIPPGIAISSICLFICMFWFFDGLNKSLQMVHIHNSRDIEDYLRGDSEIYWGPSISLRFEKKMRRHLRPAFKNLDDESIFHLYASSILIAVFLIFFGSYSKCKNNCEVSWDWWIALIGVLIPLAMFTVSKIFDGPREGKCTYAFFPQKKWKNEFREEIISLLKGDSDLKSISDWRHFGPYKADFHSDAGKNKFVVFIDGNQRSGDQNYILYKKKRSRALLDSGYTVFNIIVPKYVDRIQWSSKIKDISDEICTGLFKDKISISINTPQKLKSEDIERNEFYSFLKKRENLFSIEIEKNTKEL